jgi:hypothetical protein
MHKESLVQTLQQLPSKISLTHDALTLKENWPYAVVTAHWIGND